MNQLTKPLLYNGFQIKDDIAIVARVEKIFFTEVYSLTNNQFFYLFLNIKSEDVVDRNNKYDLVKLKVGNVDYIGVVVKEHSHQLVTHIIEDLTTLNGFEAVAGMNELKELLRKDVIYPLQHPEKYKKFKLSVPNGILLFGPPGCGKTFIIRKLGEELGYSFIEVKHSDIASPYIHGSVEKIGKVFNLARLKSPSILFIDEIEGLVPKRENLDSTGSHKQEEINEFLMQLNDAGKNKVLVVGATNRPHLIDEAIMRSGRMDKRIFVPPPDFDARKELFHIYLSGRPHDKNIDFNKLSKMTENYVSSDIELIVTEAARLAVETNANMITEDMIVRIIDKNIKPSITIEGLNYYQGFLVMERT